MKKIFLSICFLLFAVSAAVYLLYYTSEKKYAGPVEKIRLSAYKGDYSSLIYVAKEKGYFKENGIDLELTETMSGPEALGNLLAGRADLSTESLLVLVSKDFHDKNVKIITSIAEASPMQMVLRADRGIKTPADIKGKKIALVRDGQGEYYLSKWLVLNNLTSKDVERVYANTEELEGLISSGQVDGVVAWEPYPYRIKKILKDNYVVFPGKDIDKVFFVISGDGSFIEKNPALVERFLSSLYKAEQLGQKEIAVIAQKEFFLTDEYVENIFSTHVFELSLKNNIFSLLENMRAFSDDLADKVGAPIPNYISTINADILSHIKPDAVTIFK